jgi:hypothetical protein
MSYVLRMHFCQAETWRLPTCCVFGRCAAAVELRFIRNAGAHASHGLRENVAALRIFRGLVRAFLGGSEFAKMAPDSSDKVQRFQIETAALQIATINQL